MHKSYEAWLPPQNVAATRPVNVRASQLLQRPDTRGPILIQKTTMIKSNAAPVMTSLDILAFERVDEAELKGDVFKNLRAEWVNAQNSMQNNMLHA